MAKVKANTTKITNTISNHIDLAISQIGVKEVGVNAGESVKKYLKSTGLNTGNSWCMAFVYWCVSNSTNINPLIKSAHVKTQFNAMQKKGITGSAPKIGSIFCMSRKSSVPNSGHTGFVTSIDDTYIYTIEGNIKKNGIEGVHINKRSLNEIDWGYIYI